MATPSPYTMPVVSSEVARQALQAVRPSRAVGLNRLKKLGQALIDHEDKYAHRREFLFSKVLDDCGTAGCAIGHCALVFPRHWADETRYSLYRVEPYLLPALRNIPQAKFVTWEEHAEAFFGLNRWEVDYLFMPDGNRNGLPGNSTAAQVGQHILNFVEENRRVR